MYCNYSKNKFDNELTFIKPSWFTSPTIVRKQNGNFGVVDVNPIRPEEWFIKSIIYAETAYMHAIKTGFTPQQAREVLPLCTKSELIMTGFESDWKDFLDKRLKESTGKVHPDMKQLAEMINDKLNLV